MKVALVYDWLNTKQGGGEQVISEIAAMYPDAPVYTLLYDRGKFGDSIAPERVRPSRLQRLPGWLRRHPRYLLPLIPSAIESYDLSEYDLVISVSSAWSKSVLTRPETLHICYCFSPARMLWDYWPRYLDEQRVNGLMQLIIRRMVSRLRVWDYFSAERVDHWIGISDTVVQRIHKYYRQPAERIFPGIELSQFEAGADKDDYFFTIASLTPYKKLDLAISACQQLGKRLIIAGDGPDRTRLEKLAGPRVDFVGRISDEQKADYLTHARAFLFPSEEDFGITPLEAMASGTPVIAYRRGGVTETVVDGETGIFFDDATAESLIAAIKRFETMSFDTKALTKRAGEFSVVRFRREFGAAVQKAYDAR